MIIIVLITATTDSSLVSEDHDGRTVRSTVRSRFQVLLWLLHLEGFNMCVCVFFPSILDIKFVGRTSRGHTGGRSHRIFNPPSFCGACLDFCREKDSAIPFPRRP